MPELELLNIYFPKDLSKIILNYSKSKKKKKSGKKDYHRKFLNMKPGRPKKSGKKDYRRKVLSMKPGRPKKSGKKY